MEKCPICNSDGVILFSSFECKNSSCQNFVSQSNEFHDSGNRENGETVWFSEPVFIGEFPNKNRDLFPISFNVSNIIDGLYSVYTIGDHIKDISFGPPQFGKIDIAIKTDNYCKKLWSNSQIKNILTDVLYFIAPTGIHINLEVNNG